MATAPNVPTPGLDALPRSMIPEVANAQDIELRNPLYSAPRPQPATNFDDLTAQVRAEDQMRAEAARSSQLHAQSTQQRISELNANLSYRPDDAAAQAGMDKEAAGMGYERWTSIGPDGKIVTRYRPKQAQAAQAGATVPGPGGQPMPYEFTNKDNAPSKPVPAILNNTGTSSMPPAPSFEQPKLSYREGTPPPPEITGTHTQQLPDGSTIKVTGPVNPDMVHPMFAARPAASQLDPEWEKFYRTAVAQGGNKSYTGGKMQDALNAVDQARNQQDRTALASQQIGAEVQTAKAKNAPAQERADNEKERNRIRETLGDRALDIKDAAEKETQRYHDLHEDKWTREDNEKFEQDMVKRGLTQAQTALLKEHLKQMELRGNIAGKVVPIDATTKIVYDETGQAHVVKLPVDTTTTSTQTQADGKTTVVTEKKHGAAGAAAIPEYPDEATALKAGHKVGERVKIGGVIGTLK